MKYIDADKLIAEIEKKRKTLISEYNELAKYEVWRSANDNKIKIYTISDILSLINSLQQEQPKFKVGDTIHKIGENTVFPMTIERIYDGDYVCVTEHQQSFINIKFQDGYELVEQEQPEVDLDEEITRFWKKEKESGQYIDTSFDTFVTLQHIAYHFANWQKEQDDKVKI